ncbi:hypothetical protein AYO46_06795 [Betaproteobacteria bacterium SCGC AG-212-J23]|nr:hypothetical protein AYO46_06795 [Betaproteobacteria bacterium SCGC AG-212-J23]
MAFTGGLFAYTARLASATRTLSNEAKETAKRQLRAYLSIDPDRSRKPSFLPNFDEWHTSGVKFILENKGQTPAYDVEYILASEPREFAAPGDKNDLRPKIPLEPIEFMKTASRFVLNPGGQTHMFATRKKPLGTEDRQAFMNKTKGMFIYGQVRFRDAFSNKQDRWAKFAAVYVGDGGATSAGLYWLPEGNDAN